METGNPSVVEVLGAHKSPNQLAHEAVRRETEIDGTRHVVVINLPGETSVLAYTGYIKEEAILAEIVARTAVEAAIEHARKRDASVAVSVTRAIANVIRERHDLEGVYNRNGLATVYEIAGADVEHAIIHGRLDTKAYESSPNVATTQQTQAGHPTQNTRPASSFGGADVPRKGNARLKLVSNEVQ